MENNTLDSLLDGSFEELITTNSMTDTFQLTNKLKLTIRVLDANQTMSAESYFDRRWVYAGDIVGRARKISITSSSIIRINDVDIDRSTPEKEQEADAKIRAKLLKLGGEVIDCIYDKYMSLLMERQKKFKDFGGALKNFLEPPQEKSKAI